MIVVNKFAQIIVQSDLQDLWFTMALGNSPLRPDNHIKGTSLA